MKWIVKLVTIWLLIIGMLIIFLPNSMMEKILPSAKFKGNTGSEVSTTDFVEAIKIIYGNFKITDAETYTYGTKIPFCRDASIKITTKSTVNFFVDVDSSYIQLNNESHTFVIDTTKVMFKYMITEQEITKEVADGNCFTTKGEWIDECVSKSKLTMNDRINNSKQIAAAKRALRNVLNNQIVFLIQSGYENKQAAL